MLKLVGQRWLKTILLDTSMFKYWLLHQLLQFVVMQRIQREMDYTSHEHEQGHDPWDSAGHRPKQSCSAPGENAHSTPTEKLHFTHTSNAHSARFYLFAQPGQPAG